MQLKTVERVLSSKFIKEVDIKNIKNYYVLIRTYQNKQLMLSSSNYYIG